MKLFRLTRGSNRQARRGVRRSVQKGRRFERMWSAFHRALPGFRLVSLKPPQQPFFTALHELLDRYPVITLGHLLQEAGEQAWGLTVFFLSVMTFIPGVANILSLATLLVGLRLMAGAAHPWIPSRLRDMPIHRGRTKEMLAKVEARIEWLAKRRGPRRAPSSLFMGFLIAWTSFLAMLPIPFPFANMLPASALVLFSVAMLEEWPMMAWLGSAISLGTSIYFAVFIHEILVVFAGMWRWVSHLLDGKI